ncbi:MAG: hypothetical protein ACT4NX_09510 [Deltaproteobacteria bacterium]
MSSNETDFLTKIKQSLGMGIKIVNVRSKEVFETVKAKNQIQTLRGQRTRAVNELGKSVYRTFKHTKTFEADSVRAKCVEIEKIEDKIKEAEEALRLVHESADKALLALKAIEKPKAD